jgi:hypothetical protein
MELEPDFAAYWSGARAIVYAHRWWLAAVAGAFVLGALI